MPMIGGERAAEAALVSHHVPRKADAEDERCDLSWVTDWLYGDGSLPPQPLPLTAPVIAAGSIHAELSPYMRAFELRLPARPSRRRTRQLALL